MSYPGSAVDNAGNLTLSAYNNANYRDNYFNQTNLTTKVDTGPIGHRLFAGLELGYQDNTSKRNTGFFGTSTSATVPASNPFAIATRFAPNGTDADNDVTATIVAGYVQDQITLLQQLKVLAGVRYDYFKVDLDDHRTTTPAVDLARTDHGVSPRAALLWTPLEAVAVYLSYSYAFLPSGEQLELATTTADLARDGAQLRDRGALGTVAGAVTLGRDVSLEPGRVRVADPAARASSSRPVRRARMGRTRAAGHRHALLADLRGLSLPRRVYHRAHLQRHDHDRLGIIPAGNKIGLVPHNTFAIWNRFTLGAGWETGLGVIYQSSYFTSLNNTVNIPGFTRVDGAVYYTLPTFIGGSNARLAVNIENLFNTKYFPTVDGDNNTSPGGPITAKLTLSATF